MFNPMDEIKLSVKLNSNLKLKSKNLILVDCAWVKLRRFNGDSNNRDSSVWFKKKGNNALQYEEKTSTDYYYYYNNPIITIGRVSFVDVYASYIYSYTLYVTLQHEFCDSSLSDDLLWVVRYAYNMH